MKGAENREFEKFENRVRHTTTTAKPKTPVGSPVARHTNGPDPHDLRAALEDVAATPTPSPSRKRQRIVYQDRYVCEVSEGPPCVCDARAGWDGRGVARRGGMRGGCGGDEGG